MPNTALIQQTLAQDLWELAAGFTIADEFLQKMPQTIELILRSKSMDSHEEKQSWFTLLPMMNDEQMGKLNDILTREKQKLDEIEKKYEQKKDDAVAHAVQKWEDGQYKTTMDTLKNKEAAHQAQEAQEADALLTQI
jgi:hypothetical protein